MGRLTLPEAKTILSLNLPEAEWKSIYFSRDVSGPGNDLRDVARLLDVEIPTVKKYRRDAYDKLELYFFHKYTPPS